MGPEIVLDLFAEALMLTILIISILVVPSLIVGLIISMFQAATQINEQTLSFLPRLLMTLVSLMIAGPFILNRLMELMERLAHNIPLFIG